jgi:hypothetical protein
VSIKNGRKALKHGVASRIQLSHAHNDVLSGFAFCRNGYPSMHFAKQHAFADSARLNMAGVKEYPLTLKTLVNFDIYFISYCFIVTLITASKPEIKTKTCLASFLYLTTKTLDQETLKNAVETRQHCCPLDCFAATAKGIGSAC